MKRLLLTMFVFASMLTWTVAQTDVTKFFLTNYAFDSGYDYTAGQTKSVAQEILEIPGWTQGFTIDYTITGIYEFGFAGTFNNGTVPSVGYDGEAGGGLALSTGWAQDFYYTQTVTLPAGSYTLTVPTYNGFTATAGKSMLAWIPNSGATVSSSVSSYSSNAWTVDQISFTLNSKTTGNIRIGYKAGDGGSANSANLVIDNLKLTATDIDLVGELKAQLQNVISSANQYYGDGSGNKASVLKAAIDVAQQVYDKASATPDEVFEQKGLLTEAIAQYRKDNISPENPYEVFYIANPSFEDNTNGWTVSDLKTQSNSEFSKKKGKIYVEKWVEKPGAAGDASVSQQISLPNGIYRLTVGAQNLSQASLSTKNTGMYVFAGDQQTPIYTPDDYSVDFTVITGTANIGVKAEGATGNWLALDNFRIYQIGFIDEAALIEELSRIVTNAEGLLSNMMSASAKNGLSNAISSAKEITSGSKPYDAQVTIILENAIEVAEASIAEYQALADKIAKSQQTYDESKNGAAEFKAVIDEAILLSQNDQASSAELAAEIVKLDNAELAFNIANATEGTGVAPAVTYTNPDFVGGATKAMLRATFAGSNILERGVCWSTDRNPVVTDNRSTKTWSLNGYILVAEGLTPATVYYMRPYIMNNTYQVAYGDEVKVVTHPAGNCTWSWDEAGPDAATNDRCRTAIKQTIDYFNEWTGVKGFHLSGHYVPGAGAGGGTADCSYGGWMRISQNEPYQAIGTVLHETGHGVGVGTQERYWDTNVHSWYWYGREANKIYHFLENEYTKVDYADGNKVWVGDGTHAWGQNATYDWLINGADKDRHSELQYAGGSALLYGMFIDGLDPTSSNYSVTEHNGIAGYTFNFDDDKKYYIMCKDAEGGFGTSLMCMYKNSIFYSLGWKDVLSTDATWVGDSAAWYIEYLPKQGYYRFKNVKYERYLTNQSSSATASAMSTGISPASKPDDYNFQLMPDRRDVSYSTSKGEIKTHGYWFTWTPSLGNFKAMSIAAPAAGKEYGTFPISTFDYADSATKQMFIIISEDELPLWKELNNVTGIKEASGNIQEKTQEGKFLEDGKIVIYKEGKKYNPSGQEIK